MTFIPNPHFQEEFLQELDPDAMQPHAEAVLHETQALAPDETGDYKDSLEIVVEDGETYVVTRDFAGHMVEWGSINNPPYAPLRRGVRAAGLELRELPKP